MQRGTTYKGALVGLPGPVLLGLASIEPNGGFRYGGFKTYGGDCPEKISLKSGDLYVSLKDVTQSGDLLGSIARVPSDIESGRLTQDTVKLVFDGDPVSRDYIYWLLRTPAYREYCRGCATGTTTLGLSRDDFLDFPVPSPAPADELLIELLEGVEKRITLLRETNATLEAIAQALFKSWFVDFDPVRAKAEGRQPEGMDATTAALFPDSFDESELGLVPKGWACGALSDLANLNPESWTARTRPETVAYVDLANAKENVIAEIVDYRFDDAPSRARRVLRDGDTIIGTVRPGNRSFAFIANAAENLTGSTGFAVLRPKSSESAEFVYLAATSDANIEYLTHVADGGAYPAVRPEVVVDLATTAPPAQILLAFHQIAKPLFASLAGNHEQAQTLTQLRDTLLPRLISGQLRVPDAERTVEDALA